MIKKAGLFVDDGCRNCGVLQWARLLHYSPQFELSLLEAEDICNGNLDELDLFICPGGGSARQLRAMQESGQKAVKRISDKLFIQGYKTEILTPTHKDWNEDLIISQKDGEPQWTTQLS